MKKQLLAVMTALILTPATAMAQTASDPAYYDGFNNFAVKSEFGTSLGNAISKDPHAYCKDVGLGNDSETSETSHSNYDRGSETSTSNAGGGGSIGGGLLGGLLGSIGGNGGSNKSSNNTWDFGGFNGTKTSSSTVVKGKDCSAIVSGAVSMENNRIDNETKRYDIDKREQVAIRQIEAGQIQNVFGAGAQSMLGGFGR